MVGLISGTLCGEVAIEVSILNDTSDNTTGIIMFVTTMAVHD